MLSLHSKRNGVNMKDTVISREAPALKNKRRFCKVEGCNRIVKSQGLCQRHGAKPQKCRVIECTKQAQGGFGGMCKAHFRASQNETLDYQVIGEEAQVESVNDRVIPASLSWTPRSGGPMPLIAHLKEGMDAKKPPGWHRNEERRARRQAPVSQLTTEFDDWEIELLYSESLILTGTSQLSFKYLAYGWGREIGFHTELVKSVCASRRVMLPPSAICQDVAVGSTESTTSSHQSSRASGQGHPLPPPVKDEDTSGASSAASGDDDSSWRRAQMVNQASTEQHFTPEHYSEPEDPRSALAAMSSKLTGSDEWMKYSVGQLEEVDERKPAEFPATQRPTSFAVLSQWESSNDWMDSASSPAEGNNYDQPSNNERGQSTSSFATMSPKWNSNEEWVKSATSKLDDVDESKPSTFPLPGNQGQPVYQGQDGQEGGRPTHHRGHLVKPRSASEEWVRGSIGQMDDLDDIEYSTYCLSMQFDEVTLQNIYHEQQDES